MQTPVVAQTETERCRVPLLDSVRELELVCPACRGELIRLESSFECPGCPRTYPSYGGIPDFRVFADPFLNVDEDRQRAARMLDKLEHHDLESLLHYYWSLSTATPPALRAKFARSVIRGEARARRQLDALENGTFDKRCRANRILEIGSGTGNFLSVAAQRGKQVVGADIAMRWLHVSRRRFQDQGLPTPPLICCCAESLPFRDGSFDLCAMSSTLEFVQNPHRVLAECARTLGDGGSVLIQTVNRFSIVRDPYAYLWGIGFLPRRWQSKYVRWRNGAVFDHTRLLSYGELKRLANRLFRHVEFALPDVDDGVLRQFPFMTRMSVQAFRRLKEIPALRPVLNRIGPEWNVKLSCPVPPRLP